MRHCISHAPVLVRRCVRTRGLDVLVHTFLSFRSVEEYCIPSHWWGRPDPSNGSVSMPASYASDAWRWLQVEFARQRCFLQSRAQSWLLWKQRLVFATLWGTPISCSGLEQIENNKSLLDGRAFGRLCRQVECSGKREFHSAEPTSAVFLAQLPVLCRDIRTKHCYPTNFRCYRRPEVYGRISLSQGLPWYWCSQSCGVM